jgi:hypothetical protein
MPYDKQYTQYITRIGLLPFVSLVSRSTPNFNPSVITSLVDCWRPETHTFHLRAGELTVTLQDVSMILVLPIDGAPVCFNTNSTNCRELMFALIGKAPPKKEDPTKDRVPVEATYKWIRENFAHCPADASGEVIEQYALGFQIEGTCGLCLLTPEVGLLHGCG